MIDSDKGMEWTNLRSKSALRPVEESCYHLACLIAIVINGL